MSAKKVRKSGAKGQAKKSALSSFIERDLTQSAREGQLQPAFETESQVERLVRVFEGGRVPVVVGDRGVGKTALVEELVRRGAAGDGPLANRRVVQVSLRGIVQSTRDRGELGERIEQLLRLLRKNPSVTPFLRDLHLAWDLDLEGTVESMCYRLDRPFLAEGEVGRVRSMLEYMPSLEQHLALVKVDEPAPQVARRMAVSWATARASRPLGKDCDSGASEEEQADSQTWRHVIDESALDLALDVASRFLVRDQLPRTLLEPLAELADESEGRGPVTVEDVVTRACAAHGLPPELVDPRRSFDLAGLQNRLNQRVLGQPEAVGALVDTVGLVKAGLADPRRPFGVFLFAGPTGVGKTHLVRLVCSELFGSDERLMRVNMADYQSPQAAETLFGEPHTMSLAARRGVLTQRVSGQPFGVLLLDEFEKATATVHDRFMQLFDEGAFVNGASETVSCRSLIIIATSNAGAEVWSKRSLGFDDGDPSLQEALTRALRRRFRVELLNRFDRVVPFAPLDSTSVRQIARREIEGLATRSGCARRGLRLEVTDALLDQVAAAGFDPELGARPLRRVVEQRVATALARAIANGPLAGHVLRLDAGPEDSVRVELLPARRASG